MKKKVIHILRMIFGYAILAVLFGGGATFFGYMAALCIGGDGAAAICQFIYKQFAPVLIRLSTVTVLFGLVIMYLDGELALTAKKK